MTLPLYLDESSTDCSERAAHHTQTHFCRYALRGGMQDFNYHFSNCFEVTIEVSCCKYPPLEDLQKEWSNNIYSILRYLKMANMGIKGFITDRATGKPIQGYHHTHTLSFLCLANVSYANN